MNQHQPLPSSGPLAPPPPPLSEREAQLSTAPREERAAILRPRLEAARARLAAAHAAGVPGDQVTAEFSSAVDQLVCLLFAAARSERTPPIAMVAVGGYGRAELCPYSDLDLWFLAERPDHPEMSRVANEVLYPLWDLRLDVGHGVRSVADSLALGQRDLAAATALLDMRFLDGDRGLHQRLAREHRARLSQREAARLVQQLVEEKAGRHARFGDTVYLLEPNVKNGEGGYRDLLVALWAAKARFAVADFPELVALGQATARQAQALVAARRFFLQVRTAAHLHARRRQDRLLFEIQEAIAPVLFGDRRAEGSRGPMDVKPAVAPAVEALMQRYYLNAKAVKREGGRLLERCAAIEAKKPTVRKVDHAFVLWNGQLSSAGPEVFRDRPSEMVRIFRVALDTGAEIYGHTRELIAEACGSPEALAATAAAFAADTPMARDAHRDFLALLTDARDQRSPSLLEQMHDLGLLAALMPEFQPCTGRVQHDLYHVFTVDQHQLYAVARLKALARGELATELPVATRAIHEVSHPTALYLGTLLHDVGKPLGKGHSEKGARLAHAIASRLGLPDEERLAVEFLVRQHLLLSHVSQRRDLNDTSMLARLAEQLGGPDALRDLYLLTVADMSMVAPGNLTGWKEQLLRDLYVRTLAYYRRGPDLAGAERSRVVARRKARVVELLAGRAAEAEVAAWMGGLPDRYFAQTPPSEVARHLMLSRARATEPGGVAVEASGRSRQGGFELTVIAEDAPGLLAGIAGVLLASRIDVHGARIASRSRGGQADEAIDVFLVRDLHERGVSAARLERLRADLRRVIGGQIEVEALIAERRERSSLPARVIPHVPIEVELDNDVSTDFSVIDVYTQDRPGVLYTITRTLSRLGLDIHLSKVATEAARVADVFYVRAAGGKKLDGPRGAEVVAALRQALTALPGEAA